MKHIRYVPLERRLRCRYGRIASWFAGRGHAWERLTLLEEIWAGSGSALGGIPGTPGIGCAWGGGGDLQHFQPEGDVPGAWEGFIHIAKPSLIVGAERRTKRKQGDWSAVRTSALHCTTQMATKSGAGERDEDREPKGEPARRSDLSPLYRDRSRIAFIRGYRESDSHGSLL